MQITIEENLAKEIVKIAKTKKESPTEFINSSLREVIQQKEAIVSDEEKVRRTLESYRKFPQQPEEYEIWLDEQVWEDE
jgi:metal-responsive CopG/Arc/MetJ family transcriptional regulator